MSANLSLQKNNQSPRFWYWGVLAYAALPFVVLYYGTRMVFAVKYRKGLRQRLTLYNPIERQRLLSGPYIWVHTVSLGELSAARPLLRALKENFPPYKILVSTVTETGQALARCLDEADAAVYLPLDIYPLCRRSLRLAQPAAVIIFETELWPNFIRATIALGVPRFLVNARLSDKSFDNYLRAKSLFAPLLNQFNGILAQSGLDAGRFAQLGVDQQVVRNCGNIKFDSAPQPDEGITRQAWRGRFQIQDNEVLVLGGSTFSGEEHVLARVFRYLRQQGLAVRLVAAPRHVHRTAQIEHELSHEGFKVYKRSEIETEVVIDPEAVILLNTTGELSRVYAAADVVFMGKSLCSQGGQNPIEPAAWGRAVVFGPNMQNFRDVSALLVKAGAAQVAGDEEELTQACLRLCQDAALRKQMGVKAQSVVTENRGALACIMRRLDAVLGKGER